MIITATDRSHGAGFLTGLAIIILSSITALDFARYQFGGYDLSPLIDLNWRIKNGEIPGQDFINTMPSIIIILFKASSFQELSWINLTFLNSIGAGLVYLYLSLYKNVSGDSYHYIFFSLIIAIPLVYTNHIWHSSFSQYLGIMYVYSTYICLTQRASTYHTVMLVVSSALIVTGKQNIAAPYIIITVIYILTSKNDNKYKLLFGMFSGITIGILLTIYIFEVPLNNLLYSYSAVFGRSISSSAMLRDIFSGITNILSIFVVNAFIFLSAFAIARNSKSDNRLYLLLCGFFSFIPIFTDWDSKVNNISLPIFIFFLVCAQTSSSINIINKRGTVDEEYTHGKLINYTAFSLIFFIFLVSLYGGYSRERMKNVGPFYEVPADIQITGGYFDGLRTGKQFSEILHEIKKISQRFKNGKIFFGPRIEFGYALTQTRSPFGLPLWWHPGTSYATINQDKITGNFIGNEFDILIFARSDRTRMPIDVINHIQLKYIKLDGFREIDVYLKDNYENLIIDDSRHNLGSISTTGGQ